MEHGEDELYIVGQSAALGHHHLIEVRRVKPRHQDLTHQTEVN